MVDTNARRARRKPKTTEKPLSQSAPLLRYLARGDGLQSSRARPVASLLAQVHPIYVGTKGQPDALQACRGHSGAGPLCGAVASHKRLTQGSDCSGLNRPRPPAAKFADRLLTTRHISTKLPTAKIEAHTPPSLRLRLLVPRAAESHRRRSGVFLLVQLVEAWSGSRSRSACRLRSCLSTPFLLRGPLVGSLFLAAAPRRLCFQNGGREMTG